MTITTTINRVNTVGDGSVTAFSFPYLFFSDDDLKVILVTTATGVEVVQVKTTHYTVTGAGVTAGGVVNMGTPPASTETLVIIREEQFTQTLDLVENDPFPSAQVEQQLDTLTMLTQQINTEVQRSVKLPDGDSSGADTTLSTPIANAYLLWDAAGTGLTTSTTSVGQSLGGNGTVSLPFYSYSADPDSGHYRIGANNLGLTVGGTKLLDYGAATLGLTGALTTSGIISVDDTTESTSGTTGSIHTDGGLGVAKKLHVIGTTTHGGDVLSDTDSTDSLGSTGVRWLKLWVDTIQTTGNTDIAGDLTVTGNLTINGTTVTNDATNTEIKDPLIELNSGATSNANDLGLIMERGSTGDNVFMGWDESGDYFGFGTTAATGDSTGNITYSLAQARFAGLNLSGTSADLGAVTTIDINGGTVDGAVIGGAAAAAITGTTLTANTSITLATGGAMTGVLDSDTMSGTSAALLSTSESIKAYVDNNAPENGVKFAFESTTTDTDQGAGKVWLNNGTPSSASVLYVDDVEAGGVSVNAWVDTWDDVSNAAARGYVYIASYGTTNAILVYKVTGAVTSASTYSKVAVTHVLTVGTISDGDSIGLTFVPSGSDGAGSGDMEASNNLSDVASAATSFGNIKQAASTSATGVVEIATDAETNTGSATDKVITPANLTQRAMLQGERELWIPAGAMIPRVTNGPSSGLNESSTNKVMSRTLDFDASTSEYAQFNGAFPNSWNEGTITAEFYWTAASGSGNVLWGIAGVAVADDGILDASFGTRQTILDALTATTDLMKSAATSAVTIKDTPANGKMTYFQIDRDADDGSDSFGADARLVGVTIRYTVNAGTDA